MQGHNKPEETVQIAPEMFLARVGASDSASVLLTPADEATVAHWQSLLASGWECPALAIEFDSMGNVLSADGRHRALAAKLAGVARVAVQIMRRP